MSPLASWLLVVAFLAPILVAGVAWARRARVWDRDEIDELIRRRRAIETNGPTVETVRSTSRTRPRVWVGADHLGGWPTTTDLLLTPGEDSQVVVTRKPTAHQ